MDRNTTATRTLVILLAVAFALFGVATSCKSPTGPTGDTTAPTVSISSTMTDPTDQSPIRVSIVFSEAVTSFDDSDLTLNPVGVTPSNFMTADNETFTVDIGNLTPETTVTLDIAAGVCADAAGNPNTAASTFSRFYTSQPVPVITSATAALTNADPIPITITFGTEVEGFVDTEITLTNCTISNFSTSDNKVWTADLTPSTDGLVQATVPESVCNKQGAPFVLNLVSETFSRTYDGTYPTVTLSSSETSPTKTSPIPITITFSEEVTGFGAGGLNVTNGTAGVVAGGPSVYTCDITPSGQAVVTIDVFSGACQDPAGNDNTAASSFNITYDTDPTVVITSTTQTRTGTYPIPITITFNEPVTGFDNTDLKVGNGSAGVVAGGPSIYTCNITPTVAGTATTVDIDAGVCEDMDFAANPNTAALQFTRTYITSLGVGTNFKRDATLANYISIAFTVVAGNSNNVLIAGVSAESNTTTVPTITEVTYGGVAMDIVPNSEITYTYDTTEHRVAALYYLKNPTTGTAQNVTATFNAAISYVQIGGISLYDAYVHGGNDPIGAVNKADGGASATVTTYITTKSNYSMLVDVVAGDTDPGTGNTIKTTATGQARHWFQRSANGCSAGSTKTVATAGIEEAMGWNVTVPQAYALLNSVAEIKIAQ